MRSKLFRIGFGVSLAVFMGAVACLGCALPKVVNAQSVSTESESFSSEAEGLIVPKDDDPVVFTTESGLDIKYGKSGLPDTYGDNLGSGNLKGFPYFTTTKSSTTYTWVIIGQSTNMSGVATKQYLDTSPAGTAIQNDTKFGLEKYYGDLTRANITENDEIPANSVLVLLNTVATTTYWASSYNSAIQCFNNSSNNANATCRSYYTNDTFGFDTLKPKLTSVDLWQYDCWNYGGSTERYEKYSVNMHFFPLDLFHFHHGLTQPKNNTWGHDFNFQFDTYLTKDQYKSTSNIMGRSAWGSASFGYLDSSGTTNYYISNSSNKAGIRPACVLNLT